MLKKIKKGIWPLIVLLLFILCNYFYINTIDKLEKSHAKFQIQQLLLLDNNNVESVKVLLSSSVRNGLIQVKKDNILEEFPHFCADWVQLEKIILENTTIGNKDLSDSEKSIYDQRMNDFKQINTICK